MSIAPIAASLTACTIACNQGYPFTGYSFGLLAIGFIVWTMTRGLRRELAPFNSMRPPAPDALPSEPTVSRKRPQVNETAATVLHRMRKAENDQRGVA
jgi:hypothetical protein